MAKIDCNFWTFFTETEKAKVTRMKTMMLRARKVQRAWRWWNDSDH
jgi:hypothetical protein